MFSKDTGFIHQRRLSIQYWMHLSSFNLRYLITFIKLDEQRNPFYAFVRKAMIRKGGKENLIDRDFRLIKVYNVTRFDCRNTA